MYEELLIENKAEEQSYNSLYQNIAY
jgi:hypothetical protein